MLTAHESKKVDTPQHCSPHLSFWTKKKKTNLQFESLPPSNQLRLLQTMIRNGHDDTKKKKLIENTKYLMWNVDQRTTKTKKIKMNFCDIFFTEFIDDNTDAQTLIHSEK